MMRHKRGRPKKLDPVRGEDLWNGNLTNNNRSGFDEFDNATANAASHQDVLRDAVLATLADRIAGGSNLHDQNSNKYASAFDELPAATRLSMAGLNTTPSLIGIHQALLSETVIDTLVDTILKRLAERDLPSGQQLPAGKVAETGYILSSGRQTSMLETLPPKGLASSSALHHKVNAVVAHNRPLRLELEAPHEDCEYKQQELDRAKAVISEVMGMHATVPFNTPVDPIALGIPDYFDVVDTPMDFSAIYNNIENGVKYKNSEDVLKDVEHIWKSCRQYYSKGDHIMDLMELVKKNFMRCWISAGLYNKHESAGGYFAIPSSISEPIEGVTKGPMEPVSNKPQLEQDVFRHQQPLQPLRVYRQSNQPDYRTPQPQLPILRDDLGTDCTDSIMKNNNNVMDDRLQRNRYQSGHVADEQSDSIHDQSKADQTVLQPHQATGNHSYHPCYVNEEESSAQDLASKDTSFPDPIIDSSTRDNDNMNGSLGHLKSSLDSQPEGGCLFAQPLFENSAQNHSQTNELQVQPCISALRPYPLPSDGDADFSSKRRRTRGPTKCLCVWSRREDRRIFVPINKLGEPIGSKAAKLSNFLGTIARDGKLVPLSYITWKKVPAEIQEKIWQLVQSKFDVDPQIRGWVFRNLATKFANWKAHLKSKHYNPHQTDEERLADRDKRVLPGQWQHLINFWNSEESQKQSERNKANRTKVKFCHTSGTKSFARLSEERAISNGKEPTKAELFILTRTRKDGKPVNESSSMAITQLQEKLAQLSDTVQNVDCVDEILFETIGQNKCRRTRISGGTEKLAMGSEIEKAADKEVSQMRQKMELMEQKYRHMESLMNKVLSNIETSSTNERAHRPLALTPESSGAPDSPIDQVPNEKLTVMPASLEVHPRKKLKAQWTSSP